MCLPLVETYRNLSPAHRTMGVFLEGATSRCGELTGTWQYDMANSLECFASSGLLGCQDAQPHMGSWHHK